MPSIPILPQEVQDMIIDHAAADFSTLFQAVLVSRSWRLRTYRYLHAKLVIRAVACRPTSIALNDDGSIDIHFIAPADDPTQTFEGILATVPPSFDAHVTTLVLCTVPIHRKLEYAGRGIELIKPDLDACTVGVFLQRFPNVTELVLEDVNWVDCLGTSDHCVCMEAIRKRHYRSLTLRRICHIAVGSNAIFVARSGAAIGELTLDRLAFTESLRPPYEPVPVERLTFGLIGRPDILRLPRLAPSTLRGLDLCLSYSDTDALYRLIRDHQDSLEYLALSISWFGNGENIWDRSGLGNCSALTTLVLTTEIYLEGIVQLAATQRFARDVLEQVPTSITTVRLIFQIYRSEWAATPLCLLPDTRWMEIAARCRTFFRLQQFCVEVKIPASVSAVNPRMREELRVFITSLFTDTTFTLNITVEVVDRKPVDFDMLEEE